MQCPIKTCKPHKYYKVTLALFSRLLLVHRQINTAASFLKCTSPPCFPLLGSVPVRTMAQNSQSADSAGDGLSVSNNFPAWLEMCLLYLYHYAALPASFSTTKQKLRRSCSYSMWALCKFCLQLCLGLCAGVHPSVCHYNGGQRESNCLHERRVTLRV